MISSNACLLSRTMRAGNSTSRSNAWRLTSASLTPRCLASRLSRASCHPRAPAVQAHSALATRDPTGSPPISVIFSLTDIHPRNCINGPRFQNPRRIFSTPSHIFMTMSIHCDTMLSSTWSTMLFSTLFIGEREIS